MGEKPTAAFVLSLIGGVFILLSGLAAALIFGFIGAGVAMVPGMAPLGGAIALMGFLGLIFGILVIVGAVMINSGVQNKVKTGSIVVLVFSILSLFTVGGGFLIGFILGLIGSILGLTWKPEATTPPPPPT